MGAVILRNGRGNVWVSFHFETGGDGNSAQSTGPDFGNKRFWWKCSEQAYLLGAFAWLLLVGERYIRREKKMIKGTRTTAADKEPPALASPFIPFAGRRSHHERQLALVTCSAAAAFQAEPLPKQPLSTPCSVAVCCMRGALWSPLSAHRKMKKEGPRGSLTY